MDAAAEQDLTLPEIRARVGIRYGGEGPWLPFTVVSISDRALFGRSPLFGGTGSFAFSLTDVPREWAWRAWDDCPMLRERCVKCNGVGEVMSKKKGETFRSCPKCKGAGETACDDPFETAN
jgi:hypothetical protein